MSIGGEIVEILYIADDDMFPVRFEENGSPDYAEVHVVQAGVRHIYRVRNPRDALDWLLHKKIEGDARTVRIGETIVAQRLTITDWEVDYKALASLMQARERERQLQEGYVGVKCNVLRTRRNMDFSN